MLSISKINAELIAARPYYTAIVPGWSAALAGKPGLWIKAFRASRTVGKNLYKYYSGKATVAQLTGEYIFGKGKAKALKPVNTRVTNLHKHVQYLDHDWKRKNGIGGRNWITTPGRYKMVIVYHDANRAGPHIDIHIGRLSVIYRVKPHIYEQLRYNRDGRLTADSQKLLIDFVKSEIANGSRLPQNLDHSVSNARAQWYQGDITGTSYGDGYTRQIITETEVDVYKAYRDGPIEFYAPALNPHRSMYLYKIYNGTDKRAPILIWGNKSPNHPVFDDRLHLKLVQPDNMEKIETNADMSTSTAKYDGSSCYIVITPKGTTVWSPRISKTTDERIEYTFKLDGIANTHSDETIVAMGEVLFKKKSHIPFRQPEYLPCAVGSGILNSNLVLPENVEPEIRLYRVDRIGRQRTGSLDFWENRELQEQVAQLDPHLKVVELMSPEVAQLKGFEGVVVVPEGAPINDGYKVKWLMDPHDWRIDKVDFYPGEKGGIAGVVRCTSLESGKTFNLGPGQVGDRALTEQMMAEPELYEGSVIKVSSRIGHEGRASKLLEFHPDKGLAPV